MCYCNIHTDEGIDGIGEACAYGNSLSIKDWVNWLAPQIVGKDSLDSFFLHPNGKSWAYDTAIAVLIVLYGI